MYVHNENMFKIKLHYKLLEKINVVI